MTTTLRCAPMLVLLSAKEKKRGGRGKKGGFFFFPRYRLLTLCSDREKKKEGEKGSRVAISVDFLDVCQKREGRPCPEPPPGSRFISRS